MSFHDFDVIDLLFHCLNPGRGVRVSLMIWGCITYEGVGTLTVVDGNINAQKYIEVIDNFVHGGVHSSPGRRQLSTHLSIPNSTLHSSLYITFFQKSFTVVCLFNLHHASHFLTL
jgi:hypothetical protein